MHYTNSHPLLSLESCANTKQLILLKACEFRSVQQHLGGYLRLISECILIVNISSSGHICAAFSKHNGRRGIRFTVGNSIQSLKLQI